MKTFHFFIFILLQNDFFVHSATTFFNQRPKREEQSLSRRPPTCQHRERQNDLLCFCNAASRRYIGRLSSFVGNQLQNIADKRNQTVILTGCVAVQLELDYGRVKALDNQGLTLLVQDATSVHVNKVSVGLKEQNVLKVVNTSGSVSLTGQISCNEECQNKPISPSTSANQSPSHFSISGVNVKSFMINGLHSSVPFSLNLDTSESLSVVDSHFESIPWPGFYIHNVDRVSITSNHFVDTAEKAIALNKGNEIVLTDNILNVASALDLNQFPHVVIQCNKPSLESLPPSDEFCASGTSISLLGHVENPVQGGRDLVSYFGSKQDETVFLAGLFLLILLMIVLCGTLWIDLTALFGFITSFFCCLCCNSPCCQCPTTEGKTLQNSPKIVVAKESSKAKVRPILKQKPTDFEARERSISPQLNRKPEKYVKVDRIDEHPDEETEDDVVVGTIGLTGEWPRDIKKIRATTMSDQDETSTEVRVKPKRKHEKEMSPEPNEAIKGNKPATRRGRVTRAEFQKMKEEKEQINRERERSMTPGPRCTSVEPNADRANRASSVSSLGRYTTV